MSAPQPAAPANLSDLAAQAFAAHAAMLQVERDQPELSANPFWKALRETAFARFRSHYERSAS